MTMYVSAPPVKVSDLVEFERPSDRKPNKLVARGD